MSIKPHGDAALFLVLEDNFNFEYIFLSYDEVWIIKSKNFVLEEMFINLLQRNKYKSSLGASFYYLYSLNPIGSFY